MPTSTLAKGATSDLGVGNVHAKEDSNVNSGSKGNLSRDSIISEVLDKVFEADRVIQLTILGLSSHLVYAKYGSEPWFSQQFSMVTSVLVAYVVNLWMSATRTNLGVNTLPTFNTIYLFYMQLLLSTLFVPQYLLLNTVLAFSISDISVFFKIPLQIIFLLMGDNGSANIANDVKALALNYFFIFGLYKTSKLKSLDKTECHMFALLCTDILALVESDSIYFQVFQVCFTSFIVLVTVTSAVSYGLESVGAARWIRTLLLLPMIVVGFSYYIQTNLIINNVPPFTWLIDYIGSSMIRLKIMGIWLGSALLLLPSVFALKSNWSLNTSRKVWHFAILPLLIPAIMMDSNFVKIALAGTVNLFLIVEYIRFLHIYPVGHYLDKHLRSFADFRDEKGPIIISYLYFIIGISLPFLINGSIIGIISLGVGDSLASIIGKKFGRNRWPNTCKTFEGTFAFIAATGITTVIMKVYFNFFTEVSFMNLVLVCFLAGILEGNSTLNDNLLIPTFMLILLESMKE
ncbi:Sec59 [Kluyveromyces lactis]|nr:Sec59 [Kluyveromyces lactis]